MTTTDKRQSVFLSFIETTYMLEEKGADEIRRFQILKQQTKDYKQTSHFKIRNDLPAFFFPEATERPWKNKKKDQKKEHS